MSGSDFMLGQRGKEEGGMKSPKVEEVEELGKKGFPWSIPSRFCMEAQ